MCKFLHRRKLLLDTPGEKLVPLEEDSKELAVLVEFLYAPDFAVAEATVRAAYHFSDKYDVPLLHAAASKFMQEARTHWLSFRSMF